MRSIVTLIVALSLSCITAHAQSAANTKRAPSVQLLGAGASFPAPLIMAMADEYRDATSGAVTINYQSIGSSSGIRQFLEQTVAFGATEALPPTQQLRELEQRTGSNVLAIPITVGDVVVIYHLPDVEATIVFDHSLLASIFLGEVTNWNDPAIAALNPGVTLPDLQIHVVHRADGSGSTNIFTQYLATGNSPWEARVGIGTAVDWPVGLGAQGNEGVAGVVANTPGALGYTSLAYAKLSALPYAALMNEAGEAVLPNATKGQHYPATGFTWALVYEQLEVNRAIHGAAEAAALVGFLSWAVTEGQYLAELLHFAPLPPSVQQSNIAALQSLTYEGEPIEVFHAATDQHQP